MVSTVTLAEEKTVDSMKDLIEQRSEMKTKESTFQSTIDSSNKSLIGEKSPTKVTLESSKQEFLMEDDGYFTSRANELAAEYNILTEFPSLSKNVNIIGRGLIDQTISFSPINETNGELYKTIDEVLGDGTNSNPKNLAINIFSKIKYTDPENPDIPKYKTLYSTGLKSSGLGIIFEGQETAIPLYFIPSKTKFYQKNNSEIKILSGVNTVVGSTQADFVIELTAKSEQETAGVDFKVEIINNTETTQKFGLVYLANLETKDAITEDNQTRVIQKMDDGKGYYLNNGYRDNYSKIVTELTFPENTGNDPIESEIVEIEDPAPITGFRAITEEGEKTTINPEESEIPTEPDVVEDSNIKLKSLLYEKAPNDGITLNWHMMTEERNLEILPNEDYRAMDAASGIDLSKFKKTNIIPPLKVDSSAYDGLTTLEHYLVFGKANPIKDSLEQLKSGNPSDSSSSSTSSRKTNLNFPYEKENGNKVKNGLGPSFPRIISYTKPLLNTRASKTHFYSYTGKFKSSGDDRLFNSDAQVFSAQGFGIATFKEHKGEKVVDLPVPTPITPNLKGEIRYNRAEEAFISNDGKTILVYGKYELGNEEIPVRVTAKTVGNGGKVQVTYDYLNTINRKDDGNTEFGMYYGLASDVNGKKKESAIKTLGGMDGVYFDEKQADDTSSSPSYYVAYNTRMSDPDAVGPSNILIYDFYAFSGPVGKIEISPWNWRTSGLPQNEYNPKFDESQAKGEKIRRRDSKTGGLLAEDTKSAYFTFVYDNQSLAYEEMGRADLEMRVSDIEIVEYSKPNVSSEKDNTIDNKEDMIYQSIIEQPLDANTSEERYKPIELNIETSYSEFVDAKQSDFSVFGVKNLVETELTSSDYLMAMDESTSKMTLTSKDPVALAVKYDSVRIKQNSKIKYDVPGIEKHYNEAENQFKLPIKATNSWRVLKTKLDGQQEASGLIPQGVDSVSYQKISYEPNFTAIPKENASVGLNSAPGEASKYVTTTYEPVFTFDTLETTYKDNILPIFDNIGTKMVDTVVKSKSFGHAKEIQTPVSVTNEVKMTVKHVITNKQGELETIHDLATPDLDVVPESEVSVKPSDNIADLIKPYEDVIYSGYDFKERIIKDGSGVVIDDITITPTSDFTVELHYTGKITLNQPTGFDFGKHKINLTGYDEQRPKITHENGSSDLGNQLKITNTEGTGSSWKLGVKQTKPMKNGNSILKGELYYIPNVGEAPIIIGENEMSITQSGSDFTIFNQIPLLPETDQKSGVFMDIYSGNKPGQYSDGEITWNLTNAL